MNPDNFPPEPPPRGIVLAGLGVIVMGLAGLALVIAVLTGAWTKDPAFFAICGAVLFLFGGALGGVFLYVWAKGRRAER
jgi:hypothetical protein